MPKAIIVLKHRTNQTLNVIKHQQGMKGKKKDKANDANGNKKAKAGKRKGGKRKVL